MSQTVKKGREREMFCFSHHLLASCLRAIIDENRKILHEQDVEKSLMALLAVENSRVRSAACQAVAVMSRNSASKDTFRHLGI